MRIKSWFPFSVFFTIVLCLKFFVGTGDAVIKAMSILVENGVLEENVLLLSLFATPASNFFIYLH